VYNSLVSSARILGYNVYICSFTIESDILVLLLCVCVCVCARVRLNVAMCGACCIISAAFARQQLDPLDGIALLAAPY